MLWINNLLAITPHEKARLPKKTNKLEKQQAAKSKYLEPDEYSRLLKELYRKEYNTEICSSV